MVLMEDGLELGSSQTKRVYGIYCIVFAQRLGSIIGGIEILAWSTEQGKRCILFWITCDASVIQGCWFN